MDHVEKCIEVEAPVSMVYNQWTQFEEFPRFMEGVEEVKQLDEKRLYWRAEVGGKILEWDAEIFEQIPDQRIAWRSKTGTLNTGMVNFESLGPNRTKVSLKINYKPEGAMEKIGSALGIISQRVEGDLERFKEFIEARGAETGAWIPLRGRFGIVFHLDFHHVTTLQLNADRTVTRRELQCIREQVADDFLKLLFVVKPGAAFNFRDERQGDSISFGQWSVGLDDVFQRPDQIPGSKPKRKLSGFQPVQVQNLIDQVL